MPATLDIRPAPAKGTNVIHAGCNQAASLRQLGSITDKRFGSHRASFGPLAKSSTASSIQTETLTSAQGIKHV